MLSERIQALRCFLRQKTKSLSSLSAAIVFLVGISLYMVFMQYHTYAHTSECHAGGAGPTQLVNLASRDEILQQMTCPPAEPCPAPPAAPEQLSFDGQQPQPLDLNFEWTFFITPQDFIDEADFRQRRAIKSWQLLTPKPTVVLLGSGIGYDQVAKDLGVIVKPTLDLNFAMLPLAGSLVYEASIWPTNISCILNSDIVLTQSFANTIAKMNTHPKLKDAWFLSGARLDLTTVPDEFDFFSDSFDDAKFTEYVKQNGVLHTAGGLDYFVWNKGPRITAGPMPPFIRGKSKFDNWIVHEAIASGLRQVVDGSQFAVAAHIAHAYVKPNNEGIVDTPMKGTFWQKDKKSNWMIFHNSELALNFGSYTHQSGTTMHIPWKLSYCEEPLSHNMCLIRRVRPAICPCEHSSYAMHTQSDPEIYRGANLRLQNKKVLSCGAIVYENRSDYQISALVTNTTSYGLPFILEDLLPVVARNNTVLLTGGSFGYRDMLMNFVCNLRRLGIYDHLLIAAFDEEMYRFGFRMGLPIFFNQQAPAAGLHDFDYGSQSFRRLTKLKSQMVLRILKYGFNVIWTDSDIIWYQNPIPLLHAMPSDLVVQSNAPWPQELADNGSLRINSGFYRVRSTPLTIDAFTNIVISANRSRLSEQPNFYMVLCGGKEGRTIQGTDACIYTTNSTEVAEAAGTSELYVQYLDRQKYPNGAVGDMWVAPGFENMSKTNPDIVILHNNWIRGLDGKQGRLFKNGLWWYNNQEMICNYHDTPTPYIPDESNDDGDSEKLKAPTVAKVAKKAAVTRKTVAAGAGGKSVLTEKARLKAASQSGRGRRDTGDSVGSIQSAHTGRSKVSSGGAVDGIGGQAGPDSNIVLQISKTKQRAN